MRKELEGSYTVEAAFILPLVFALLYGIVFLGFYLHDHVVIQQSAWEGVFYGAGQVREVTETEVWSYIEERLDTSLLITEVQSARVILTDEAVSAEITAYADAPGFISAFAGIRRDGRIQVKRRADRPKAADYVRKGIVIREQLHKLWNQEE